MRRLRFYTIFSSVKKGFFMPQLCHKAIISENNKKEQSCEIRLPRSWTSVHLSWHLKDIWFICDYRPVALLILISLCTLEQKKRNLENFSTSSKIFRKARIIYAFAKISHISYFWNSSRYQISCRTSTSSYNGLRFNWNFSWLCSFKSFR